jgi:hypothetical protein
MNNKSSQTSYEYNQNAAVSDNGTERLVHDSKYHSVENILSAQFETDGLQNGFVGDCSSFQTPVETPVAQNHGTLENTLFDEGEETNNVEYDTCFGTVSQLNGKSTT